jgi:predicted RNA-binding Zn-ribbon protein involved in translation (DUF1610 family)
MSGLHIIAWVTGMIRSSGVIQMEDEFGENEDIDLLNIEDDDQEETTQVCPVCGSIDLYYEAGGVEGLYHCKHCGYIGSFIVEANEEMARLIRKEYDSREINTAL